MTPAQQTYYQIWQMERFGNVVENADTHHMQDECIENGFDEMEAKRMVAEIQFETLLN